MLQSLFAFKVQFKMSEVDLDDAIASILAESDEGRDLFCFVLQRVGGHIYISCCHRKHQIDILGGLLVQNCYSVTL